MKAIAPNSANPARNTTPNARASIGDVSKSIGRIGATARRSTRTNQARTTKLATAQAAAVVPSAAESASRTPLTPANSRAAPSQSTFTADRSVEGG